MAPVKLPRYVIFQRENDYNLCLWPQAGHDYLKFNSTNRDLWGSQEVIPAPGYDDVVMIKSLYNDKYWRRERTSDWIWADKSDKPRAGDKDCLFKVVRVNDKTAALQCVANSCYLSRLTKEGKENCLNAGASDYTDDDTTLLRVTSALVNRRVSDVEYDMDEMTPPSKSPPKTLGRKTVTNSQSRKRDIELDIEYTVESQYSWRTVTTFNTGLDLIVTAGIPDFDSKSPGKVSSQPVKNGEMYPAGRIETITHTVKGVEAGETVLVEIKGSPASATVPFKYKFEELRVDGKDLPEESGKDGVFEGVQVLDIKPEETRKV